jgi:SAM-dependent methyltransferase
MSLDTCPLCSADDPEPVFALAGVPVLCNQLWPDAASARAAPTGDLDLVVCRGCALIWNRAFDPARMDYGPGYENALHFSPKFRAFAEELGASLVTRHRLAGRSVVEIGCGDGYMLDLMVRHGAAQATGFDPSMTGRETPYAGRPGVTIVADYYRSEHLDGGFDAILCRHVLEHLEAPAPLLAEIRRAMDARVAPLYIEVPNAGWMLDSVSMWDVIYEHVTYWTAPAMEIAFRRAGFLPLRIRAGFGEQFLMAEALPAEPEPVSGTPATEAVRARARAFAAAARDELSRLRDGLGGLHGTAVIWGAGSKGITCANALGEAAAPIAGLVDVNPRKHGRYIPGAALPVVGPEALRQLRPELVLLSNAHYRDEVAADLRELGLRPELAVIAG